MDTDRNLLFGVLALQADLLDNDRFAEVCAAWAVSKQRPLADLLLERGWLTPEDRADVERLLERKLKKHHGDATAGLAEVSSDQVKQSLAGLTTPPLAGHVLLPTAAHVPESRDRYKLARLHASGGIGRVWLARDDSVGRDVALKELRPENAGNPAAGARFLREAQVTGQLEHPGVVPIYEVGRRPEDQAPFYTMRFVRGRTLAEAAAAYHRRRRRGEAGPLELRELLGAFVGICNAVAYAHSRGVIHRDLKPQNVVLGDYGEAIVLDWGLAKLLGQADDGEGGAGPLQVAPLTEADATMQGQVLGTPAYMAPEQADGRLDQFGPATDVYGLGAVLYEVLVGKPPFSAADTTSVLCQVIHDAPTRPRTLVAGTPPALEAVCLKVERWLAGEPVQAHREGLAVRAGRWMKRHRVLVTSGAAAALVALVGLTVVLAVQARSNRELASANQQLADANERERQRFELAQEAISTFHKGVSEDLLLKQPEFKRLRNQLLSGAAEFYRKLEGLLQGQGDRQSRSALARAYFGLGQLTGEIGSKEEALALQQHALAVRQALAEEAGADAWADVADSHSELGKLLSDLGKRAEAQAEHEQARDLYRAQAQAHPDGKRFQSGLARCYTQIGILQALSGKPEEVLASHEQARAIYEGLAANDPGNVAWQRNLARCDINISTQQFLLNRTTEALASSEKALAIAQKLAAADAADTDNPELLARCHKTAAFIKCYEKPAEALKSEEKATAIYQQLAEANPAITRFQDQLAQGYMDEASVHKTLGQPAEGLGLSEKALAIYEKLVNANPGVTDFRRNEAECRLFIGDALAHKGQWDAAASSYQQALGTIEALARADPAITDYQYSLCRCSKRLGVVLHRVGRPADAVAAFRRAIAITEGLKGSQARDEERFYNLACYHALLSAAAAESGSGLTGADAQAEADRAMDAMTRAVASGFRRR